MAPGETGPVENVSLRLELSPTGGALDSHEELPGPIYLEGSEKGHLAFRDIVVTPAKHQGVI